MDEPFNTTDVTAQVNVISAPALTFGVVLFKLTIAVSFAVQPFTVLVTVKTYVPAAFTVGVAVVPPETIFPPVVVQLYVTGDVDEPFNTTDVTAQVKVISAPALTFGAVMF